MINIRKARKEDLENYIHFRKEWDSEYAKMINRRLRLKESQIKKEFSEILKYKKRILLILDYENKPVGFLIATFTRNLYSRNNCYVDDIFIIKDFRRKGLATKFMKEFMKILKKKKIGSIILGVYLKNKGAQKLYEKLGFKTTHYEMERKIK